MSAGIDYGMGLTNIDKENGIRYGVIPQNDVLQAWADESEPDYGEPHCPKCDKPLVEFNEEEHGEYPEIIGCADYACESCKKLVDSQEAFGEEPLGFVLNNEEYQASCSEDDIFIIKSPYYTRAQFCSPCAPGAGHLRNPTPDGVKTYCFDPSWFDPDCGEVTGEYCGEKTSCPYPVYRVDNNELVFDPHKGKTFVIEPTKDTLHPEGL